MPTGPGDEILDAIEAGKTDDAITKQYGLNGDQLKTFKSLYYGLTNQKMTYDEIGDLFPELNSYFRPGQAVAQNAGQSTKIEKPDFTKPVHEKLATESTALLALKQSKAAADYAKNVESLQQMFNRGASESLVTVNKALAGHDDVVNKIIRQGRYNQAKEQGYNEYLASARTDMPAAAQLMLERNRILPQESKPQDEPISPDETAQKKAEIQGDEGQARFFINQVAVHKPEEAKDLERCMYVLDATARLKTNPSIGLKVNENIKGINEGKYKYNAVTQQLTEDEGFMKSLVTGIKERTRQMQNYDLFQGSDADVIKLLEKRMASYDPDQPIPVPTGAGEIGQMAGMEWKSLLKGAGVSAATSLVPGGESAAPYITAAINSPEYYQRGYSTALEDSYKEFRQQGKTPEESLKLAREQAKMEGKLGAAEGFVSSFLGGRIGLKAAPKFNITGGFKSAVNSFIKSQTHNFGEITLESFTDGLVAGYLQDLKDTAAIEKGLHRDSEKSIKDNIKGEVYFGLAMGAMTAAGKGLVSPDLYNKLKYFISKQDPAVVNAKVGEMVLDGQISKEEANNISTEIKKQQAIDKTVPQDVKDISRMAMIEKIKERDALEEEKKNTDKALHPELQVRIDKLNDEILEHSKHKKQDNDNDTETDAKTQAEAEGANNVEPGVIFGSTENVSQPAADANIKEGIESTPVGDSEHNIRLNDLNEKAEKLGYKGIKQLNSQEQLNENASPEIKQLLKEYGEHNEKVKGLTDENDILKLDEHNFGNWIKANDVQRDDLGRVVKEDELSLAAKRIRILKSKGLNEHAENEITKLKDSRKKEDWTQKSWNERFDEELSDKEIRAINNENKLFNEKHSQVSASLEPVKSTPQDKDLHYTNPEGTSYLLRGDDLYHVAKNGKETKFSEKAMKTPETQELIGKIKETNNETLNEQTEQNAIQGQREKATQVPTSTGNRNDMDVAKESQGSISRKISVGKIPASQQQKQYEASIGMEPTDDTGRVMPAPIEGAPSNSKKKWEIIQDVSRGLKQRIIYAKQGPGVLGAYYPGFKGIKITYNGDLDTTAHELGHAIDDHFDLYTQMAANPNILQELDQFSSHGSLPPDNHPNPRRYIDKEGFAEWMRAYIVNPDVAEEMAPQTTLLYKSATTEEFQKTIKQFSDDFRIWRFSEGRDQLLSNVRTEYEKQKGTLSKLFKKEETDSEFSINWVDRLAANMINPLHGFEKAFHYAKGVRGIDSVLPANDPIILSRILNGIDGKYGEILKHGMTDAKNNVLTDSEGNPKNLKWLLAPFDNTDSGSIKKDMEDAIAYMLAQRTVKLSSRFRRGDHIIGVGEWGITDLQIAQKTLGEFEAGDPERLARIQEGARRYREFADDILKYAVGKGRMSEEQFKEIKKNNDEYVALQRYLQTEPDEEIITYPRNGGKELGAKGEITYKIKGSNQAIKNPYASILDILYKTIRESDRNEVLRAFRDMLWDQRYSNDGQPKRLADIGIIGEKGNKESIPIFVDGKPEYWIFQKDIFRQLKAFDLDPFRVWGLLRMPGAILRFATTHFPTFAGRNWVRDLQDRLIKSTTGSGFKELWGNKEDWRAIARAGGLNSGYYLKGKDAYYGLMTEAMGEMAKKKNSIVVDPDRLKSVWHKYEDLLYKGETSNRVAEYRSAFKKGKNEGMDDYNAMIYAAFKARDLIDFAIAGHWMQKVNQIVPFSNAAVQGLRSGYMSAKDNWKGFAGRMLVYSILPGAAAWWYNNRNDEDKDKYKELPSYQRDMFWNFRIGPNKWLSIPKPYELALPQAGMDRALSYFLADDKEAFEGYGADVRKLLLPFDEGNVSGPFQSVVEGLANYDFFRDRTIIPPDEDPLDLSLRHTETASRLGQLLQNISDWDARKWDHFIQRQFSYTGNFALKLSDIGKEGGRHEFDLTDTGLFKRSPAYNAKSVQNMITYAKSFGLTKTPAYKGFNGIVGKYFTADNDQEREDIAKQMIDYSRQLLLEWKARSMSDIQVQRFEAKKAAQSK